ncbi:hypothetical protein AYO22_01956 [Fonsecaea multimorphosa]|nr:hypothetical protein AYO22_01956 [Fonsecaea multimorphosa]
MSANEGFDARPVILENLKLLCELLWPDEPVCWVAIEVAVLGLTPDTVAQPGICLELVAGLFTRAGASDRVPELELLFRLKFLLEADLCILHAETTRVTESTSGTNRFVHYPLAPSRGLYTVQPPPSFPMQVELFEPVSPVFPPLEPPGMVSEEQLDYKGQCGCVSERNPKMFVGSSVAVQLSSL